MEAKYLVWYPNLHRAQTSQFETEQGACGLIKDLRKLEANLSRRIKKENITRSKRRQPLRPEFEPLELQVKEVPVGFKYRIIGDDYECYRVS